MDLPSVNWSEGAAAFLDVDSWLMPMALVDGIQVGVMFVNTMIDLLAITLVFRTMPPAAMMAGLRHSAS